MGKLHQVLAVLDSTKKEADAASSLVQKLFSTPTLFMETEKTLQFIDDDRQDKQGGEFDEHQAMEITVGQALSHFKAFQINYLNTLASRETSNQGARANVVVDGNVLISDAPVSFLIKLEEYFKSMKKVYESIPTLSQSTHWQKDESKGEGIWTTKYDEIRSKKEKIMKTIPLFAGDEHHPPQFQREPEEEVVGKYTLRTWSGMIPQFEKDKMIQRCEKVIRAVKRAREEANSIDAKELKGTDALFSYIHGS